jgi:hypothetical protein
VYQRKSEPRPEFQGGIDLLDCHGNNLLMARSQQPQFQPNSHVNIQCLSHWLKAYNIHSNPDRGDQNSRRLTALLYLHSFGF